MTQDKKDRLTARDFHPEVLRLFDRYVHGAIDRRGFLEGAAKFVAVGTTAAGLLDALNPKFAAAQQVDPSDDRLVTERVDIPSPAGYGTISGYLVRPRRQLIRLPVVLVVHENRGLNPHIEDIARRVALENFVALAPDALTPLGGYPGDEDKARELFGTLDQAKTQQDFIAAARYALDLRSTSQLGVVGFCYGGAISNFLATQLPQLRAAAPFYGTAPTLADVPKIEADLLLHFAETDDRVNATWVDYEPALKAAEITYTAHTYPGTQHGFNNDTTPRYDQAAADLAWERTIAFFNRTLRHHRRRRRHWLHEGHDHG